MKEVDLVSSLRFALFDTKIGFCAIAWAVDEHAHEANGHRIVQVQLPEADAEATRRRMRRRVPGVEEGAPPADIAGAMARIAAALRGEADDLMSIALDMSQVPPFHRKVFEAARAIPPGRTRTYGEIAAAIGEPGSAQAVGQALGSNPFAPVVPCHRVLAADGTMHGFSAHGGVTTKRRMLEIEGAVGRQFDLFASAE
jgi:methylated-DNA-[protein]-cysteine S-methyltransferase